MSFINWTLQFKYEEHIHSKADNALYEGFPFCDRKGCFATIGEGRSNFGFAVSVQSNEMWTLNLTAQNMCMPSAVLR